MALTLSMTAMSPASCAEHELIAAARGGDDRAFEELYSRYRDRIAAFIAGRVGDYGRAEDIAQEVFMAALRRLRATDQKILFKPWIYEIAKNACIDEYRRTRRTHEVSLDADLDEGGPRPLLSLAPAPPQAVENRQKLTDLTGAFGGLSESHHKLLVLREFEGRSYDEIGAETGMSRQMVESALFRARRKLTEEYNELASGRRCQQVQAAIDDGRAMSVRSFGVRERRQFARHLSHCQACRAAAHLAGVDESLVAPRSIGAKIAALLPFPFLRWPFGSGRAARGAIAHPGALRSLHAAAASGEPAGASAFGGAAVAAAVLALTGAGIGVGIGAADAAHSHRAPAAASASGLAAGHSPSSAALTRPAHPLAGFARAARASMAAGHPSSAGRLARPARHSAHGNASGTAAAAGVTKGARRGPWHPPSTGLTGPIANPTAPILSAAGQTASGTAGAVGRTVSGTTHAVAKVVGSLPAAPSGPGPAVNSVAGSTVKTAGDQSASAISATGSAAQSTVKTVSTLLGG